MDGSENFTRGWADYVSGFGGICGEHWLGLEKIHCLTTRTARSEMRIDMAHFRGIRNTPTTISLWSGMLLVSTSYRLRATTELPETVLAVATVLMEWHSPYMIMTMSRSNCAAANKGGWWYNACMCSQLIASTSTTQHQEEQK